MQFDINKKFNQDKYIINLSDSFLSTFIGLNKTYYDLSSSNIFDSSFNQNASYTIDGKYIAIISPSGDYGNKSEPFHTIPLPAEKTYTTYQELETAINICFNNYVDEYSGLNIFSGTNVNFKTNPSTQKIDCSLTVIIQKILC